MRLKLAIIAADMVVATACSGAAAPAPALTSADIELSGSPIALTLWHTQTGANAAALQAMVDRFNSTNGKGVTVTLQYQGSYTQLYQKNLSAIQAGALPELAVAYESFVADYMKADVVLNLDPYVNSVKNGLSKDSQADIYKSYYDTNRFQQFGNQLLSFPFTKSLFLSYNNEDVLKEIGKSAPKTWDEFGGLENKVLVIEREEGKGVRPYFEQLLNLSGKMVNGKGVVEPDKEAIRVVSGSLNAVSYINLSVGLNNVTVGVPIRLLSINKVEPEPANVSSGAYPLRRPVVAVTKKQPTPQAKAFVEFMLSKDGQKTIQEEDLVPLLVTK